MIKLIKQKYNFSKKSKKTDLDENELFKFRDLLANYIDKIKNNFSKKEEDYKNNFIEFLKNAFDYNLVLNHYNIDLSVMSYGEVEAVIECKVPDSKDMITSDDFNKKSLHQTIYYYYKINSKEISNFVKNVLITDFNKLFVIDRKNFKKAFFNRKIQRIYDSFENKTAEFYENIKKYIEDTDIEIKYVFIDFCKIDLKDLKELDALYKFLHPYNLSRQKLLADPNDINEKFFYELIYILGLKETKTLPPKLIFNDVENTFMSQLLQKFENQSEDPFEDAITLTITWLNRLLFLKLLETEIVNFNNSDDKFFLKKEFIENFSDLRSLFFDIFAKKKDQRRNLKDIFKELNLPYLNSTLFSKMDLEEIVSISDLNNNELPVYKNTILENKTKPKKLLDYLLDFLNSYDLGSVKGGPEDTLIRHSILGSVFENLNGYKDGSYYTPSSVTSYMSKKSIYARVLDLCKEKYKDANFNTFEGLLNFVNKNINEKEDILELNALIDGISIIDPSVGSGHFLVSCLNELICIKSKLGLLSKDIKVLVKRDELEIKYNNGDLFVYKLKNKKINKELQGIQELIFKTKKHIIENQLFGVDINPNSVHICKLRLWVELLKSTYFVNDSRTDLVILPNLEFKIITANSLLPLELDLFFSKENLDELNNFRKGYFSNEKALQSAKEYFNLLKKLDPEGKQISTFNPFNSNVASTFFCSKFMFGLAKFDIVLGNPPYGVAIKAENKALIKANYVSSVSKKDLKASIDTYSLFLELGFKLVKDSGIFSNITPLAFTSSDSMQALHKLLFDNCSVIYNTTFPHRPCKVFSRAEIRTSISVFKKDLKALKYLYTTKLNRIEKKEGIKRKRAAILEDKEDETNLKEILNSLEYVESSKFLLRGRIPKIGFQIEKNILEKLNKTEKIEKMIRKAGDKNVLPVFYRSAGGGYYNVITNFSTHSSQEKVIYFDSKYRDLVGAVLSSNFYWWWYQIYGDILHIKIYDLYNFRIPFEKFRDEDLKEISEIYNKYMKDIEKNAVLHKNAKYKNISTFKEYKLRKSKNLIDLMDKFILKFYDLDEKEIEYIINYELKFRK